MNPPKMLDIVMDYIAAPMMCLCFCLGVTYISYAQGNNDPWAEQAPNPLTLKGKIEPPPNSVPKKFEKSPDHETKPAGRQTTVGQPRHESAAISIEGGSVELKGNLISGYDTAIRAKNAQVSGQDNMIEKGNQPKYFPLPTGEFSKLSNAELLRIVKNLTSDMRISENKHDMELSELLTKDKAPASAEESKKKFEDRNAKLELLHNNYNEEFRKSFLPTAVSLTSEIIFRLGEIKPPSNLSVRSGGDVLYHGMLVGAHPMSAAADFLEYIALKLP